MTQLLISVKNVEESLLAREAEADLIDLKDPNIGALGALDAIEAGRIVAQLKNKSVLMSATVGEGHTSVESLVDDVERYADLGVNVIKIAVSDLFHQDIFFTEMLKLTTKGIKLVAVYFADLEPDLNSIPQMQKHGFYGAMLDTNVKKSSLLEVQSEHSLKRFVALCYQHKLISGLAGSVDKSHVDKLSALKPTFIGLRGGVCNNGDRIASLSYSKVVAVKAMLRNYNTKLVERDEIRGFSLHI